MRKILNIFTFLDGKYLFGEIVKDEDVLAVDEVNCIGQLIGLIVAKDQITAEKASRLVQITYCEHEGPILTIQVIVLNPLTAAMIHSD